MRWICCFPLVVAVLIPMPSWAQEQATELADAELLESFRDKAVEKWEKEIKRIEARDASGTDPADAILFIGSSSIRRWDDIAVDMAPFPTIQRGYGGSKYSDVAVFAPRLLHPHEYRALAIFVGNDVSGKPEDNTPDQVEQLARHVVSVSQAHQPDAAVYLIEVTPTDKRFEVWPEIRKVNERLREIALSTPNTYFIATAEHYLDPLGNPRTELFVDDRLHLNEAGYDLWGTLIRRKLDETLRATAQFHARQDAAAEEVKDHSDAVSR
ncbi:MAG: GDSL-type esterase/lipase family protein [Rubripirellula sp.]